MFIIVYQVMTSLLKKINLELRSINPELANLRYSLEQEWSKCSENVSFEWSSVNHQGWPRHIAPWMPWYHDDSWHCISLHGHVSPDQVQVFARFCFGTPWGTKRVAMRNGCISIKYDARNSSADFQRDGTTAAKSKHVFWKGWHRQVILRYLRSFYSTSGTWRQGVCAICHQSTFSLLHNTGAPRQAIHVLF